MMTSIVFIMVMNGPNEIHWP